MTDQPDQDRLTRIEAALTESAELHRQAGKVLVTHANLLAEHDERLERLERLERIARHLEVPIDVGDGMIRRPPQ